MLEEHVVHVRAVLQLLLENHLFVKAKKCEFTTRSTSFLGFSVAEDGLKADPAKVKVVVYWPTPQSRKQLQHFLGFVNFYHWFISSYSKVALPLMQLTSIKVPFKWSEAAEQAFATLKALFTDMPILAQVVPQAQFVVEVDASDLGVGALPPSFPAPIRSFILVHISLHG
ncbi:uncharacterized protein KZ484_024609 [Pholidichthys leucotaenia]